MVERVEQGLPNIEVWIEKRREGIVVIRRQDEDEPVQVFKPKDPQDVGEVFRLLNNYVFEISVDESTEDVRANLEFNPDLAKLKLGEIAVSLNPINFSDN